MDKFVISLLIILVVLLIALNVYLYKKRYKAGIDDFLSHLFLAGFENKVNAFKIQNEFVEKKGVLFVGDSITQDYNVYEYFNNLNVYNRGIGGDTTVGLAKRLEESVFNLKPEIIFILIGTNDFALLQTTPNDIKNRIELIISDIYFNLTEVKIYLLSVLPVNENINPLTVKPRSNKKIKELNNLLKTINRVKYINIFDLLLDENGNLAKEYTYDGLHLNEQGYLIVTNILKEQLKK